MTVKPRAFPKRTAIGVCLDESGSMGPLKQATLENLNGYISSMQQDAHEGTDIVFSLTKFSTHYKVGPVVPLLEVAPLTDRSYVPSGSTALYDALRATINTLARARAGRFLVVVLTDGEENSSCEVTKAHIVDLIAAKEASGTWTFVYLGANQDAWAVGGALGFHQGNTMTYAATDAGMGQAVYAASLGTRSYLHSAVAASMDFLPQEPEAPEDRPA